MSSPLLEIEHLTKSFGAVDAVRDVSFSVAPGEVVGLLGPNGAGKTTLIHMMLGLVTPTSGTVRLFGRQLDDDRVGILSRVNFSSAYIALPSNLTVWENLNVFARLYGMRKPRKRIEELLELFEIPEVIKRVTGGLSSGQQTRVNLCKAFLNDPELLFLDEPTASLDPDIAQKVRTVLMQVREERGMAMVYSSHNMREVEQICDRLVFLSKGKVVAQGAPSEVVRESGKANLEELFISVAREGYTGESQP